MNKQKFMKWALPGLLMSGVLFETMPGSVGYFSKDLVTIPEGAVWNFFSPPVEGLVGSCLMLAGVATVAAFVLALVEACFHKNKFYNLISWCSLGAGALASSSYFVGTGDEIVQPNVVILVILLACWLLTLSLKKKAAATETEAPGKHL